jgi:hypothetical protein
MHNIGNYEEIPCIDNSLQCCNENEDCEEAAVEQIAAKHQKARKPIRMTRPSVNE